MKLIRQLVLVSTLLLFAGSASAGYIEVTYDLTGSTISTTTPLGTDSDPITGTLVVRYGAVTASAPITSATLVAGNTFVSISQPTPGVLTITGTTTTVLSPGVGVTGVLGASTVTFPPVPAAINGFLHCYGGLCGFAGMVESVPLPITDSAATFPPLVFTPSVANGGFLGTLTSVVTNPVTVTVVSQYVGTETGRLFVPEPTTFTLLGSGIAVLGLFSVLRRRRNG